MSLFLLVWPSRTEEMVLERNALRSDFDDLSGVIGEQGELPASTRGGCSEGMPAWNRSGMLHPHAPWWRRACLGLGVELIVERQSRDDLLGVSACEEMESECDPIAGFSTALYSLGGDEPVPLELRRSNNVIEHLERSVSVLGAGSREKKVPEDSHGPSGLMGSSEGEEVELTPGDAMSSTSEKSKNLWLNEGLLDRAQQPEGWSSGWVLCDCGPWSLCSGAKSKQGLGGCLSSTDTSLAGRVAGRDFIAVSSADGGVVVDALPREDVLAAAASLHPVWALS